MSPGNIKLSVSTVIPCKRPVSQLFRNFDFNFRDFDNVKAGWKEEEVEQKDIACVKSNFCPFFLDPISFVMVL